MNLRKTCIDLSIRKLVDHIVYFPSIFADSSHDSLLAPLVQLKEEAVSPPPPSSNEMVTLVNDQHNVIAAAGQQHSISGVISGGGGGNGDTPARLSLAATRALTESTRILLCVERRYHQVW